MRKTIGMLLLLLFILIIFLRKEIEGATLAYEDLITPYKNSPDWEKVKFQMLIVLPNFHISDIQKVINLKGKVTADTTLKESVAIMFEDFKSNSPRYTDVNIRMMIWRQAQNPSWENLTLTEVIEKYKMQFQLANQLKVEKDFTSETTLKNADDEIQKEKKKAESGTFP